jgi:hypothetical protein
MRGSLSGNAGTLMTDRLTWCATHNQEIYDINRTYCFSEPRLLLCHPQGSGPTRFKSSLGRTHSKIQEALNSINKTQKRSFSSPFVVNEDSRATEKPQLILHKHVTL